MIALALPGPARGEVRLIPLATNAYAGSSVNVVANARQSLCTHGEVQYAAFYDAEGWLVLARRTLASAAWTVQRTTYRGHVADAHNSISLAVDGTGCLHVAWDHHNTPLNYAQAEAPGSLTLSARRPLTGEREQRVTYPQFSRLPDGDLLFLYRDGSSGNGSLVLKRYATATRTWTTVQSNLIDGEGRRSPYWDLAVGPTGTLHLGWVWRDTPDVATNHDLAYARSADGGRTWTRTDGTACPLPLTAAVAEYAQRIPSHSNLMNSPMVAVDAGDHPYLCTYWSPAPGAAPRFHVVHHDGAKWELIPGPASTIAFSLSGGGTKRPPISRAVLLVEPRASAPALHLLFRDDSRGGAPVLATHAPGLSNRWNVQRLAALDLGGWEPSVDPIAWAERGEAHLLVESVRQLDGDDRAAAAAPPAPIQTLIWSPAPSPDSAH
jgi:hypothetical protein